MSRLSHPGGRLDMWARKFSLMQLGGPAEGLVCAELGASTPIGVSGNLNVVAVSTWEIKRPLPSGCVPDNST